MKTLQLAKPHFLIVIGAPKSGKTTFANRFGDTFRAPFIEAAFFHTADASAAATIKVVEHVLVQMLKTQQTVIYEGLGGSRAERVAAAKFARAHGYEPLLIWVQTDLNVARTRAGKRSKQNPYPMTSEEFDQAVKQFTPPSASEPYVVLSGLHTYASQAKAVLKRLSATKPRESSSPARPKQTIRRGQTANRSIQVQ